MLPLLRRHVRGSEIGFWGRSLLPLARTLAARRCINTQALDVDSLSDCEKLCEPHNECYCGDVDLADGFPITHNLLTVILHIFSEAAAAAASTSKGVSAGGKALAQACHVLELQV